MITAWKAALLVALISFGAAGTMAQTVTKRAEEKPAVKEEKKAEITEAAKKALQKLAGDAKIEIESEGKNWKAEWEADDKDHEAVVDAEGKLIRSEEDIDAKDAPEAVRKAAAKLFGEDTFVEFTKIVITDGEKTLYEADSKKGEALFDATGAVVEDDDDDEGEEDDESEEDDDDEEGDDD
jgi:ribosomal protein L16/L10AE